MYVYSKFALSQKSKLIQGTTQILMDTMYTVQRAILHECEVPAHFLNDLKYLLLVRIGLV